MDDEKYEKAPPLVEDKVWWLINAAMWEDEMSEDEEKKLCDHCFAELHGDCVPGQECDCECRS